MAMIVNVHEAKTHFSRLLDKAHAGEEIVLAKAGKPYARLVPLAPSANRRVPGLGPQIVDRGFSDPLPDEELAAWEGEAGPV